MRKSQNIRTYAFLPHDLPMKFSLILPFLTRFRKKRRVAALQLDLRRNATRCTPIIAEANQNFKCFSSQISVPAPVCTFANVAFAICTFFRHLHVFSPFSPPVPPDGRCVLLPPARRSRAHLPPALSPCPTPA